MFSAFNKRLLFVLSEKNCTKSKAAEILNVSAAFVSQLCSGVRDPSDRTISDICREFEVDRIWLETGAGDPFRQPSRDEKIAQILAKAIAGNDSARDRMIRALCSLPDEYFPVLEDAVKKYVEALKQEKGEA